MKTVLFATAVRTCLKPPRACQFLGAESVAQLLDRFIKSNGRIDLLVIDLDFDPAVSSIDVALNLRRFFPRLKILFAFSSAPLCTPRQRTAMGVLPSGSIGFLKRPFSLRDLQCRIEDLLAAALLKVA